MPSASTVDYDLHFATALHPTANKPKSHLQSVYLIHSSALTRPRFPNTSRGKLWRSIPLLTQPFWPHRAPRRFVQRRRLFFLYFQALFKQNGSSKTAKPHAEQNSAPNIELIVIYILFYIPPKASKKRIRKQLPNIPRCSRSTYANARVSSPRLSLCSEAHIFLAYKRRLRRVSTLTLPT